MTDIIKIDNLSAVADFSQYNKYTIEELTEIISTIEVKAFYMKGTLLKYIKDNKRYKELGYKTFEAYTKDVLGFSRSYAYRLLNSSETYDNFVALGATNLPTEEKQLRPIVSLSKEEQIEVWQEVAKDKVPTAKEVQEAVNKKLNKVPKATKNNTTKALADIPDFRIEAYNDLLQENEQLKLKIKKLEQTIDNLDKSNIELTTMLLSYNTPPEIIQEAIVVQEDIILTRTEMVETIKQHSIGFQAMILNKDQVTNMDLFKVVVAIRNRYEEEKSRIPNPLPKRIIDAIGPEPDDNIGTLNSLPNSYIK